MTRPSPREVFEDPAAHWSFVTQSRDDDFEGQYFDRKEAARSEINGAVKTSSLDNLRQHVCKTVSAFANSNVVGGLLILGLSSNGDLIGIDHLSETQQNDVCDLNKFLLHHVTEVRLYECENTNGENRVVALIFSGWATTGICETVGSHPKSWTRNGSQCVPMTHQARENLRFRKGLVSIEMDPFCEFDLEDVDRDVLAEFRKVFPPDGPSDFDDTRLLKEAGAIVRREDNFWFTMPGILFFAMNPQQMLSHGYIRLIRFGVVSAEYRNRGAPNLNKEFKGPITSQIRAARTYFRDSGFFKRFQKREPDGGFIEEPELPPVSIDEAIVNAVAHRDYRTQLPIECEAYLDAFIVKNPGRVMQRNVDLPNRFKLDTTHLDSTPRNGKLLEWLKLIRDSDGKTFVQAVSEGTRRMNEEMIALKLPAPEFYLSENESLLKLKSNVQDREAAILAASTKTSSTETINFYSLIPRKGSDPVDAKEFRGRQGEFLWSLRDALEARDWYIDQFSFGRVTMHRRGNSLPFAERARGFVRLYPAYSIQFQEAFGRHYLCIDYRCEVLNVRKLNDVVGFLNQDDVTDINCVANSGGWRKGRIISIHDDWTQVRFYDTEQEQTISTSDVIPNLPLRLIERVLAENKISVDLHSAIKRASLASEKGAARLRAERIHQCAQILAKEVFPIIFGEYEVILETKQLPLVEQRRQGESALNVQRLNEPEVEFRNHKSSTNVRDGITKYGSFDHDEHHTEIIPICLANSNSSFGVHFS